MCRTHFRTVHVETGPEISSMIRLESKIPDRMEEKVVGFLLPERRETEKQVGMN